MHAAQKGLLDGDGRNWLVALKGNKNVRRLGRVPTGSLFYQGFYW